ncbi:hypothetical protein [Clostridium sp. FP1]|nr:hypothetical protein [Clostridium sp. FP1]MBZ9633386.1 hypothetical protein [Clostridium sp. FP1]
MFKLRNPKQKTKERLLTMNSLNEKSLKFKNKISLRSSKNPYAKQI